MWYEAIPWNNVGLGFGWALVALFVVLVYRGRLVPRTTHEDMVHDRDEWRAESRIKDQQIAEKDTQLRMLAEVGETAKAIMTSLPKAAGRDHA